MMKYGICNRVTTVVTMMLLGPQQPGTENHPLTQPSGAKYMAHLGYDLGAKFQPYLLSELNIKQEL